MPMILCAEFVATVVFRQLIDIGQELFARQPALWERLSTLLHQIMIDEVGHVTWCRARLGSLGLRVARTLLPAVKAALLTDQREFALLVGRERFDQAFAEFAIEQITQGCTDPAFWLTRDGANDSNNSNDGTEPHETPDSEVSALSAATPANASSSPQPSA